MSLLVKKTRTRTLRNYRFGSGSKCKITDRKQTSFRINFLIIFFALFGSAIIFRLFNLQIVNGSYYQAIASDQHELFLQIYPERGTIYFQERDLNGQVLLSAAATNRDLNLVYAEPNRISDPEAALNAIMEVIDFSDDINKLVPEEIPLPTEMNLTAEQLEKEKVRLEKLALKDATDLFSRKLLERLSKKDDPYEPIKHRVSDDQVAKLEAYNLQGIRWVTEPSRFYPENSLASQVLGFVGQVKENNLLVGSYGLEGNNNKLLGGEAGYLRSELDSAGRWIAVAGKEFKKATDGSDIVMTIDKTIQFYACEQLFFGVNNYKADSGSLIIMDPQTGAIIAMCSYPDFDPNNYNKAEDANVFNNPAISASYEPGSVFKAVTMAAALDSGAVTPYSTYEDTGAEVFKDGTTIRNADKLPHGIRNMTQVLEESLNLGTIYAARKVGQDKYLQYLKDFGFGQKTGIDLSPESAGTLASLESKSDINLAMASFGQGIAVTPLQLAKAYSAIANEGKLIEPHVIDKIIKPDGTEEKVEPKIVGQVISPQTAKILGSMLVSVVQNGHAQKAQIPGYLIGGKTGTAQVAEAACHGYCDNKVNHTFAAFAPYDNPKFVVVIKLENVKSAPYAESTTVPMFTKIAKFMLDYYQIAPSVK